MKALIALEDGRIFEGRSFAGSGEVYGEIVFNTSMTGYQEILTDPSYKGQIVTMTYPLIGNYGVAKEDNESSAIHMDAFVVREYQEFYSNWRAVSSLADFLNQHNVLGIDEVDTRALTRHIRLAGAKKAVVSTIDLNPDSLINKARNSSGLIGRNLVKEVTCKTPYLWQADANTWPLLKSKGTKKHLGSLKIAVIDCGLKINQLRIFSSHECECHIFPADIGPDEIMKIDPDGIFISNGPGDPAALKDTISTVRSLLGRRPIFGICLGHQILSLALGAKTYKLKFGHRGGNQPVKNLATGKIEITAQNHGFAVDGDSLPQDVKITHVNLNDQTVEGIMHKGLQAFSVQYHPENAPGPHDAEYLFDQFVDMISKGC